MNAKKRQLRAMAHRQNIPPCRWGSDDKIARCPVPTASTQLSKISEPNWEVSTIDIAGEASRRSTNMAGSQLKRLKASLRETGVIGPQQSKKQKRQNAQDQKAKGEKRLQRSEALASIREQFNPFQFKTNARGPKFDVTTIKSAGDRAAMGIKGRPGLAKAVGEERVCATHDGRITASC